MTDVVSRSVEAKALGIPMGAHGFIYKEHLVNVACPFVREIGDFIK